MKAVEILIIEDSRLEGEYFRDLFKSNFEQRKLQSRITIAMTEKDAYRLLSEKTFGIVIFDIDLDRRGAGLDLLKQFSKSTMLPVISTAREADEVVAQGYDFGCEHFIRKPIQESKIEVIIDDYIKKSKKDANLGTIRKSFVTQDEQTIEQLAKIQDCGNANTHIHGPTGVGKQVIAELIHTLTAGDSAPFIERNCSAIEDSLADSHLFGHTKGSFTGAIDSKKGLFELANGGTLFLDEIDKTSLSFQAKLLKVIEQKTITPVGSEKSVKVDFKLISASSQNIQSLIEQNKFLPDLWERLQGEVIEIKPLRERPKDIEFQLKHFIRNHKSGRLFIISEAALAVLNSYYWPGNTRELKNLVDRLQRKNIKTLEVSHLESLKKKVVSNNYSYLTPDILKLIEKVGLPETVEIIKKEAFDFFQNQKVNHRQTMHKLNLGTRAYYKLLDQHKKEVGCESVR